MRKSTKSALLSTDINNVRAIYIKSQGPAGSIRTIKRRHETVIERETRRGDVAGIFL